MYIRAIYWCNSELALNIELALLRSVWLCVSVCGSVCVSVCVCVYVCVWSATNS